MPRHSSVVQRRVRSGSIFATAQHSRKKANSTRRKPGFCWRCYELDEFLRSDEDFTESFLGSVKDVRRKARTCTTCKQLSTYVASLEEAKEGLLKDDQLKIERRIDRHGMAFYAILAFPSNSSEDPLDPEISILPLRKLRSEDVQGAVVGSSVDLSKIEMWMVHCDHFHSSTCKPKLAGSHKILTLLDVRKNCLVSSIGTLYRYFALSYVWGRGAPGVETTTQNVQQLHQPGSLDPDGSGPGKMLPMTIKDTIRLIRGLKERYLWIDRLCIVQDDQALKLVQMNAMGNIYANAYCTIVADYGDDAGAGLPGVGGGSKPRVSIQRSLDLPSLQFVLRRDFSEKKWSTWETRGWTLQEHALSSRLVRYTKHGFEWECGHGNFLHCSEDVAMSVNAIESGLAPPGERSIWSARKDWPSVPQWITFVQLLMQRQFSFMGDKLAAFAGYQAYLTPAFPGGFCYGLPEFFFDGALLWEPQRPLTRTKDVDTISGFPLPSWSWVGWSGVVSYESLWLTCGGFLRVGESIGNEDGFKQKIKCGPCANWRQHDGQERGEWRAIRNFYDSWQAMAAAEGKDLPKGWRRHWSKAKQMPWFTHKTLKGDSFWWPVPLALDRVDNEPSFDHLPPFLECTSFRAFLKLGPEITGPEPRPWWSTCVRVTIQNPSSNNVGSLTLNTETRDDEPEGTIFELVAISRRTIRQVADEQPDAFLAQELHSLKWPKEGEDFTLEYYNVMAVERDGGWCERKAIGRVEKSAWEALDLEEIIFKLR